MHIPIASSYMYMVTDNNTTFEQALSKFTSLQATSPGHELVRDNLIIYKLKKLIMHYHTNDNLSLQINSTT